MHQITTNNTETYSWSTLVNMQGRRVCGVPSPKYGFCVTSLLTGIYAEEWGERFGEPEAVDDFKESVFSGHNRTDVHRNSQQL